MRRVKYSIALLFAMFLFVGFSLAAFADSPHFTKASAKISDDPIKGQLEVSWTESGLGNNQSITYEADATNAQATYACINGGGNKPSASKFQSFTGKLAANSEPISSGKNGSISSKLFLDPQSSESFSCPSGQTLTLTFVYYTGFVHYIGVSITDKTTPLTEGIPGQFSECYVSGNLKTELCKIVT